MQWGNLSYSIMIIVPVLVVGLFRLQQRAKRRAEERFADETLFNGLMVDYVPSRVALKKTLFVGALVFIVISLMQPKWGYHWEEVKRKGIDIAVVLDLSKSMLAEDIKPNRLTRAKMEIKNLISQLKGDRIALVGFAGTAFVQCPLTLDYSTAKLFLDEMDTDSMPNPGTDIGAALEKALSLFTGVDKQHQVIVLITDGEDHDQRVMSAVQEAVKQGVTIYTIGIGSTVGAPIPVTDASGNTVYLKDRQGNVVLSKMDSELLQKIALMTGGKEGSLTGTNYPLQEMYETELSKIQKKELGSARQKKYENRFQWPLTAGLLLLVIEMLIPVRKRYREVPL